MTAPEIIEAIRKAGGRIDVDGRDIVLSADRPLPSDLVTKVREHKPEVLATLSGDRNLDDWARMPLSELECRHVALRIESQEYGTLWLVSTEAERELATGELTYTVQEARRMIGLPEPLVRQIHELKKVFGGSFYRLDRPGKE